MTLHILPGALAELSEAADWYDAQRTGIGDDLLAAVDRALDAIESTPTRWPVWKLEPRARRFIVDGFPFIVVYFADDKRVTVAAIAHTSRDPASVLSRLKPPRRKRRDVPR